MVLSLLLVPVAAQAATPDCNLSTHCYSELEGSGTTFYGMTGTWNRANMTTPQSASNPEFLDSEMWFNGSCGNYWVEEGLFDGYEPDIGAITQSCGSNPEPERERGVPSQ
ncbi:MAG: hypothetical protein ACRDJU_05935, partial [Actinomycetota bacterium]